MLKPWLNSYPPMLLQHQALTSLYTCSYIVMIQETQHFGLWRRLSEGPHHLEICLPGPNPRQLWVHEGRTAGCVLLHKSVIGYRLSCQVAENAVPGSMCFLAWQCGPTCQNHRLWMNADTSGRGNIASPFSRGNRVLEVYLLHRESKQRCLCSGH